MQKIKRISGYLCVVMCIISIIIAISIIIPSHKDFEIAMALTIVAVICALYAYYLLKKTPTEISPLRIVIGVNCIGVCILGAYEIFTSSQDEKIQNFAATVFCAFLAFFLLKNNKSNKPKELRNIIISAPGSPNNQNFTNPMPPPPTQNITSQPQIALPDHSTLTSNMPNKLSATYSKSQAQDDLRILNDCTKLMQTTTNFETFFSRYELAMKKALALQQSGMNVGNFTKSNQIIELKQNNLERILQTTYNKEISAINGLKTAKGKINRTNKLLDMLSQYSNELEVVNGYSKIVNNLKELQKELKAEQKAIISEKYQASYQATIADAERIKATYESLETEYYQIVGEPDCKYYKVCKQHNNKVYPMSEYKIGRTAPPFHEKCTCITVPYFEDEF